MLIVRISGSEIRRVSYGTIWIRGGELVQVDVPVLNALK